jgi:hypothetical protein
LGMDTTLIDESRKGNDKITDLVRRRLQHLMLEDIRAVLGLFVAHSTRAIVATELIKGEPVRMSRRRC